MALRARVPNVNEPGADPLGELEMRVHRIEQALKFEVLLTLLVVIAALAAGAICGWQARKLAEASAEMHHGWPRGAR